MTIESRLNAGATPTEPMMLRPFTVAARHVETNDTVSLEFVAGDEDPPLRFLPGQFTMLYIFGVGEVPLSISGNPARPEVLVHTVRDVGAVTHAICSLEVGDQVGIRGPFGSSWPLDQPTDRDMVVVAGGIGLAPVRPAIYHIVSNRDRYGSASIVYGARAPSELLYTGEVAEWKSRFDMNVQVTVDRGTEDWLGDVGVVTPLLQRLSFTPAETTAIICGPEIMMRIVAGDLVDRGMSPDDVFVSLERNVKCAIGFCGHCQFGPSFICKDGPVVPYSAVSERLGQEEL